MPGGFRGLQGLKASDRSVSDTIALAMQSGQQLPIDTITQIAEAQSAEAKQVGASKEEPEEEKTVDHDFMANYTGRDDSIMAKRAYIAMRQEQQEALMNAMIRENAELYANQNKEDNLASTLMNIKQIALKVSPYMQKYYNSDRINFTDDEWNDIAGKYRAIYETKGEGEATQYLRNEIQDRASENQPVEEKFLNGVTGFGTTFAGAAVSSAGLIRGLFSWDYESDPNLSGWENYLNHVIDNNLTRLGEEIMTTGAIFEENRKIAKELGLSENEVIQTSGQQQGTDSMWDQIFNINTIPILMQQAGFTAEAIAESVALAGVGNIISKGVKLGGAAVIGARATKGMSDVDKIRKLKNLCTAVKKVENPYNTFFIPAIVGSSEGAMEGLQTKITVIEDGSRAAYEQLDKRVNEAYMRRLGQLQTHIDQETGAVTYLDKNGKVVDTNRLYQETLREYEGVYAETMKQVEVAASKAGINNFIFNSAINGVLNMTLMAGLQAPAVRKGLQNSRLFGWAQPKGGFEITQEAGKYRVSPHLSRATQAWQIAKEPLGELSEEFMQTLSDEAARGGAMVNINTFIEKKYNGDSTVNVGDTFAGEAAGAWTAITEALQNQEVYKAGIYGALGSAFGSPVFRFRSAAKEGGGSTTFGRGLNEQGEKESLLSWASRITPWRSGLISSWNESRAKRNDQMDVAASLEQWLNDPKNKDRFDGIVGTYSWSQAMNSAAKLNDEFGYRNSALGRTINDMIMLQKLEGTEVYEAWMSNLVKMAHLDPKSAEAQQYVQEVRDARLITDPDMSDQQVAEQLVKNANNMLNTLSQIKEEGKKIESLLGDELDDDTKQAMIFSQLQMEDWEERRKKMKKEIADATDELEEDLPTGVQTADQHNLNKEQRALLAKFGSTGKAYEERRKLLDEKERLEKKIKAAKGRKHLSEEEQQTAMREQARLKKIEKELKEFKVIGTMPVDAQGRPVNIVLTAKDIMALNPAARAVMIRQVLSRPDVQKGVEGKSSWYNDEQRAIILNLVDQGMVKDRDFVRKLGDLGRLEENMVSMMEQYNKIISDRSYLNAYTQMAKRDAQRVLAKKKVENLLSIQDYKTFANTLDDILAHGNGMEKMDVLLALSRRQNNEFWQRYQREQDFNSEILTAMERDNEFMDKTDANSRDMVTKAISYLQQNGIEIDFDNNENAIYNALVAVDENGKNEFEKFVEESNEGVDEEAQTVFTTIEEVLHDLRAAMNSLKKYRRETERNNPTVEVEAGHEDNTPPAATYTPQQPASAPQPQGSEITASEYDLDSDDDSEPQPQEKPEPEPNLQPQGPQSPQGGAATQQPGQQQQEGTQPEQQQSKKPQGGKYKLKEGIDWDSLDADTKRQIQEVLNFLNSGISIWNSYEYLSEVRPPFLVDDVNDLREEIREEIEKVADYIEGADEYLTDLEEKIANKDPEPEPEYSRSQNVGAPPAFDGFKLKDDVVWGRLDKETRSLVSSVMRYLRMLKEHNVPDDDVKMCFNCSISGVSKLAHYSRADEEDKREFWKSVKEALQKAAPYIDGDLSLGIPTKYKIGASAFQQGQSTNGVPNSLLQGIFGRVPQAPSPIVSHSNPDSGFISSMDLSFPGGTEGVAGVFEAFVREFHIKDFLQTGFLRDNPDAKVYFITYNPLTRNVQAALQAGEGFNANEHTPVVMVVEYTGSDNTYGVMTDNDGKRYQPIGILPRIGSNEAGSNRIGPIISRAVEASKSGNTISFVTNKVGERLEATTYAKGKVSTHLDDINQKERHSLRALIEDQMSESDKKIDELSGRRDRFVALIKKLLGIASGESKFEVKNLGSSKVLVYKQSDGQGGNSDIIFGPKQITEVEGRNTHKTLPELLVNPEISGNSHAFQVANFNSATAKVTQLVLDLLNNIYNYEGINEELVEKLNNKKSGVDANLKRILYHDRSVRIAYDEGTGNFYLLYEPGEGEQPEVVLTVNKADIAGKTLSMNNAEDQNTVYEATFKLIKTLVLDSDGQLRMSKKDPKYPAVKFQVDYQKFTRAASRTAYGDQQTVIDYIEDDLLDGAATALDRDVRGISINIPTNLDGTEVVPPPATPNRDSSSTNNAATTTPIGTPTVGTEQAITTSGTVVDPDSGTILRGGQEESTTPTVDRDSNIQTMVDQLKEESSHFQLSEDGSHYVDDRTGQRYARVTSVISADETSDGRFNPDSPWVLPSTSIGNSVDAFIRDFFSLKDGESLNYNAYPNATVEQWKEFEESLKDLKARFDSRGLTLIPKGITLRGTIQCTDNRGNKYNLNVAGTLDLLAVDAKGNFYIFDIKTHHNSLISDAHKKKWRLQISLYKKLLENMGYKVADDMMLGIVPVKVSYPNPSSSNTYEAGQQENSLNLNGVEFLEAHPTLGNEIYLDPYDHNIIYEELTAAEKEMTAAVEAAINAGEADKVPVGDVHIENAELQDEGNTFVDPFTGLAMGNITIPGATLPGAPPGYGQRRVSDPSTTINSVDEQTHDDSCSIL